MKRKKYTIKLKSGAVVLRKWKMWIHFCISLADFLFKGAAALLRHVSLSQDASMFTYLANAIFCPEIDSFEIVSVDCHMNNSQVPRTANCNHVEQNRI